MYDYRFAGSARCFTGGPQTGKTMRLVSELGALQASGGKTLVCCVTPELARAFKAKAELAGVPTGDVEFTTIEAVAAQIMATPQAQEVTGRGGHVLCGYEERVLLEDMRTSTMKGKRLKELLGFLYRQLSELSTPQEWDATVEEKQVMELLYGNLNFTGGVLRYELASVVLQAINASPQLKEHFTWDNVIVDDYALLSRGMQVLAGALASKNLIIASDALGSRTAPLPFPYLKGLQEFLGDNPGAAIEELSCSYQPKRIVEALNALRAEKALATDGLPTLNDGQDNAHSMILDVAQDMGGELRAMAQHANSALERGQSVAIVGTNSVWRSNVVHTLESLGLSVRLAAKDISVKDFSDERQAVRIRKDALNQLRQNRRDGVAWRTVFAAGDYVARSVGIMQLKELAAEQGLGMLDTLDAITSGQIEPKGSQTALAAIAQLYSCGLKELDENSCEGNTVPCEATSSQAVLVCKPEELFGLHVDCVIFGGFVDGLIPSRDYFDSSKVLGARKERERARDLETLHLVLGRAAKSIIFTAFTLASLPVAERLALRIDRIYLKDGVRTCRVHPSSMTQDIGLEATRSE